MGRFENNKVMQIFNSQIYILNRYDSNLKCTDCKIELKYGDRILYLSTSKGPRYFHASHNNLVLEGLQIDVNKHT